MKDNKKNNKPSIKNNAELNVNENAVSVNDMAEIEKNIDTGKKVSGNNQNTKNIRNTGNNNKKPGNSKLKKRIILSQD